MSRAGSRSFPGSKGKFSSIEFIKGIPQNFPTIPFVLAHAGISQYEEGIALAQRYDNVYLELSGQPAQHIRQALALIGPERLLFGTDWPFWNQALALRAVYRATKQDPVVRQCILYENAARLLRLVE